MDESFVPFSSDGTLDTADTQRSTLATLKAAELTACRYTVYSQSRDGKQRAQGSGVGQESCGLLDESWRQILLDLSGEINALNERVEETVQQLRDKDASLAHLQGLYDALKSEHDRCKKFEANGTMPSTCPLQPERVLSSIQNVKANCKSPAKNRNAAAVPKPNIPGTTRAVTLTLPMSFQEHELKKHAHTRTMSKLAVDKSSKDARLGLIHGSVQKIRDSTSATSAIPRTTPGPGAIPRGHRKQPTMSQDRSLGLLCSDVSPAVRRQLRLQLDLHADPSLAGLEQLNIDANSKENLYSQQQINIHGHAQGTNMDLMDPDAELDAEIKTTPTLISTSISISTAGAGAKRGMKANDETENFGCPGEYTELCGMEPSGEGNSGSDKTDYSISSIEQELLKQMVQAQISGGGTHARLKSQGNDPTVTRRRELRPNCKSDQYCLELKDFMKRCPYLTQLRETSSKYHKGIALLQTLSVRHSCTIVVEV